MVTCPRCGFEQPRDKYCAKCGVLMVIMTHEGRAADPSGVLMSKVFLYGFIVAVFALITGYYFTSKQLASSLQEANQEAISSNETAQVKDTQRAQKAEAATSSSGVKGNLRANIQAETVEKLVPAAVPLGPERIQGALQVSASGAEATALGSLKPVTAPMNTTPKFGVKYFKANREALEKVNQIVDSGRLDVGQISVAMVSDINQLLSVTKSEEGFVLIGDESRETQIGQPNIFIRGGTDPKSQRSIGLFVELNLIKKSEEKSEVRVSVRRSLFDDSPSNSATLVIDETISLKSGGTAIVGGALPRLAQMSAEDRDFYTNNRLGIMSDSNFLRAFDEFFIAVTLK